jgi:hypothetical protein
MLSFFVAWLISYGIEKVIVHYAISESLKNSLFYERTGILLNPWNIYIKPSPQLKLNFFNVNNEDRAKDKAPYRIAIISRIGIGDILSTMKINQAATNLGWESIILGMPSYTGMPDIQLISILKLFNPDFVLSISEQYIPKKYPCYLLATQPPCDARLYWSQCLPSYKGVISGYDRNSTKELATFLKDHQLSSKIIQGFHAAPLQDFETPIAFNKLFFCGSNWDKKRNEFYINLYKNLDQAGYFSVYGPENSWRSLNLKSYQGFAPFDAKKFIDIMHNHGIVLVLHSDHHLKTNTPSARVFEAASSQSIIICDNMPLVKDLFNDSILYIETENATSEEIFNQIDTHMKWIQDHPQEAHAKAARSHALHVEKFSAEQQLLRLAQLHEDVMRLQQKAS